MTKEEFNQTKARRRVLKASLDLSKAFEEIRLQHGLTLFEATELLQEHAQLHLKALMRRTRGKR